LFVAAENTSIEKAKSVLLRVPLEKRFSIRRGSLDFAVCMEVEFDGSKLEMKAGPIRGTSSVATIVAAAELAANPNRDAMKTLSNSIVPIRLKAVKVKIALCNVV
jgi:hypothetical protein